MKCALCQQQVDPLSSRTLRRVIGWERKNYLPSRRGGSDIVMREQLNEFAHGSCVEAAKSGVNVHQEQLT